MNARRLLVVALALALAPTAPAKGALPDVDPGEVGLDPARLSRIERAVERAIAKKQVPGAVVLVGRQGKLGYARAFGRRATTPDAEEMTRDTVFDMASLTKPM